MCGRFAITLPVDAMARLFEAQTTMASTLDRDVETKEKGALSGSDHSSFIATNGYNICPSSTVFALRHMSGARCLMPMRWGFVPHWYAGIGDGPLIINARSETIAEKPAFAEACRHRRGILYIDGYYEWLREGSQKIPHYISSPDGLALAIVWNEADDKKNLPVNFAIVTTEANSELGVIHHRMPVILSPSDWPLWLGETGHGAARLMRPYSQPLNVCQVSPRVNKNTAQGAELIAPQEPNPHI